jgi:hypothetical protein
MGGLSGTDAACDYRSQFWFGRSTSVALISRIDTATQTDGRIAIGERVNAVDQRGRRTPEAQSFGSFL